MAGSRSCFGRHGTTTRIHRTFRYLDWIDKRVVSLGRFTMLRQLKESGWTLVPIDGGDQVRRFGHQAEIKLQQTVKALKEMNYQAVGFGPDDLRLGVGKVLYCMSPQ